MKFINKYFPLLVFAVILIGLMLKAAAFIGGDFLFFQDQSRDLLLVKDIVEKGNVILIGSRTGFGGLFHGPLWIYSTVPSFVISGGNPFWTLIPVYIIYSLTIIATGFFVGWRLYNKWVGLFCAFFISISAPLIASIYYMTDAHAMPLVTIAFLYSFINYLRGNQKHFIASVFFAGIGFQFEPAFAVVLLPVFIIAALIVRKINIKTLFLSLVALILSVSNFLLFDIRHNFLMTNAFLRLTSGEMGALPGYENYQNIDFRIFDRLNSAISSFPTSLYSKDFLSILMLFSVIWLSMFFFIRERVQKKKWREIDREYLFLFCFPFISYTIYILYPYPLWSHYVLPIVVIVSLFLSISIWKIRKSLIGAVLSIIFFVVALIPVTNALSISYSNLSSNPIASDSSYKNQLGVVEWILKDSGGRPFNYLVYNPSTFTYGMDYFFSWKKLIGNQKITPCAKKGLTYLIYYPHLEGDNNAYSFWKKNVIKTDIRPILSKDFFGEILVEKLEISQSETEIDPNYCQNLVFR